MISKLKLILVSPPKYLKILLACVILLLNPGSHVVAQITINFIHGNNSEIRVSDLFNFQLINSTSNKQIKIEIEVKAGRDLVYRANTHIINCNEGLNEYSFSNIKLIDEHYNSDSKFAYLRSTNLFPFGDYLICFKVYNTATAEIELTDCFNQEVTPFTPILLINPSQNSVVNTFYPQFIWNPPAPSDGANLNYTFTLVQIFNNQSALEAIKRNSPILLIKDLSSTYLQYPINGFPLENHKSYAWQVTTPISRKLDSEIWKFKIQIDSSYEEPVNFYDSYIIPKRQEDGSIINIRHRLKVMLEGGWIDELNYSIVTNDGKSIIDNDQKIVKRTGLKMFEIDFSENSELKHKNWYTIQVSDKNGSIGFITFRYYKK